MPGDARPPITERYASRADYQERVAAEAYSLVKQRLLLAQDVEYVLRNAEALWNAVMAEGAKLGR